MRRAVFLTPLLVFVLSCKDAPPRAPDPGERAVPPASMSQRQSTSTAAAPALDSVPSRTSCPPFSRSARVASQPIVDGAELVFWTSDDTAMLRRRVSTLSLPAVAESADFRTDNIHNGIRLVFVSDDAAEVVPIRLAVHAYAKDIASRCGVTYAPPKPPKKRVDPSSSSSAPTKTAAPSKTSTPDPKKAAKPATTSSAVPPAPKPPQAPSAPVKKPSGPISDPFVPIAPPAPSPPSNPFK